MVNEIDYFKIHGGTNLFDPCLITELCKRQRLEEYASDTCVCPSAPIYPLRIWGEGTLQKSKKRNINLEEPTCSEPEPNRPTTMGPLEEIGVNVVTIKELVASFPQWLGEPSTTHHSYVSRVDYDDYKKDQKSKNLLFIDLRN